ncbi:alpha-beta hydrolase superfamily lysophospholipase [Saccharothrix tamanrassetensis]|uniref:Alpha-beta hydrolase superfamily lysophospholipase n=1 Tax=Saccharothrix tamanrassetensis TaxID=1051531 RepID=A0A841CF64_9PSEU|nr:alpha/beta hydrolase [Saccharothrix tamanrassetensis]MBB5955603.1 alpha-beta hydrolase superfamily lysophospholipase [Saccharothrix tamanrassetensis]
MTADVLGTDYEIRTLPLGGGDVSATLVRRRAQPATRGAVLYVHGFADYFFQKHVAEHFTARGFDFYAIDLRAYGRSLTPSQTANYVADLAEHFEEIDAAVRVIHEEDHHERLVVMGHSTGGLITSLWAHQRRADDVIDALVLNSPWLDLAEPWITRTVGTAFIRGIGRVVPRLVLKKGLGPVYGESIHADHHGEWDFDTTWKPIEAFPVLAGWLRAVRRGHARLHRGLDVSVPVLLLRSGRSLLHAKKWTPEAMTADTVLDVAHMQRWAPSIGRNVTVVQVDNGMHDLLLSAESVRKRALAEIDEFLDQV